MISVRSAAETMLRDLRSSTLLRMARGCSLKVRLKYYIKIFDAGPDRKYSVVVSTARPQLCFFLLLETKENPDNAQLQLVRLEAETGHGEEM